jgi:hypothetical protein
MDRSAIKERTRHIMKTDINIFQHPVALVNDLTFRGSLEGATSFTVRRLLV